jgi:serine/threonine protein phosphatase 1
MGLTDLFSRFSGRGDSPERPQGGRARLAVSEAAETIYAIGDVHGCLDLLVDIEAQIAVDAAGFAGDKLIVMVGDYVDRGPQSARLVDHLLRPPPAGFERICLVGNHEQIMLDFLAEPARTPEWLELGGRETLASYGAREAGTLRGGQPGHAGMLDYLVPAEHRAFLEALPVLLETPDHIFVHAGLRPGVPLARQTDADLVWTRTDFATSYAEFGKLVVHGHTPRDEVLITPSRIALDTGAFATGVLSAVRLRRGAVPQLFDTRARAGG